MKYSIKSWNEIIQWENLREVKLSMEVVLLPILMYHGNIAVFYVVIDKLKIHWRNDNNDNLLKWLVFIGRNEMIIHCVDILLSIQCVKQWKCYCLKMLFGIQWIIINNNNNENNLSILIIIMKTGWQSSYEKPMKTDLRQHNQAKNASLAMAYLAISAMEAKAINENNRK